MGGFNGFGGFGKLPAPPQVAPPPQPQQGGMRNMGVMPYQQNPVASGMEAFGSILQTIGTLRQQQKTQAMNDFQQGMALKAQGIPGVSDEKLAKYAKKAGLDKWIDFDHETPSNPNPAPSPSQLGVAPASMTSQASPMAPPPVGPQGSIMGQNGQMSVPMGAAPSGSPDPAQNLPQRSMAMQVPNMMAPPQDQFGPPTGRNLMDYAPGGGTPQPMTGAYTQGPSQIAQQRSPGFMDRLKGGLSAVTGIGGGNVNPNSPGYAAVAAMGRNAMASGAAQRDIASMQLQDAKDTLGIKHTAARMINALAFNQGEDGKPLSSYQRLAFTKFLKQHEDMKGKWDLQDAVGAGEYDGGDGKPDEAKIAARAAVLLRLEHPEQWKTMELKESDTFRKLGMSKEDVATATYEKMHGLPISVTVPVDPDIRKARLENKANVIKSFPGSEMYIQMVPQAEMAAEQGDLGLFARVTGLRRGGIASQASIDAANEQRKIGQGDTRLGIEATNARTGITNANTAIGNLSVNQQNLLRQNTQQAIDTTLQTGDAVAGKKMSPEQREQLLRVVSPNIKGSVSPYEHRMIGSDTGSQLNANQPFPTGQTPAAPAGPGAMDGTMAAFQQYLQSGAGQQMPFEIWLDNMLKSSTSTPPAQTPYTGLMRNGGF